MTPKVRVTMDIVLRDYSGEDGKPRPLADDTPWVALLDAARRLATGGPPGSMCSTTLWLDPDDHDSASIEDVGGSWRIVSAVVL